MLTRCSEPEFDPGELVWMDSADGRQQGERNDSDRTQVDPAARLDGPVLLECEVSSNQPIVEFAGLDLQWLNIASDLLLVAVVHNFKSAISLRPDRAVHDDAEMRLDCVGYRLRRNHRELDPCQINTGRGPLDLAEFDVLDEESGDDVHPCKVAGVHRLAML